MVLCWVITFAASSCQSLKKNKQEPENLIGGPAFWTDGLQDGSAEARAMRGDFFLKQNALEEGVRKHSSGMQSIIMKVGEGVLPGANDIVTVKYKMKRIDGTLLDDSENDKQLPEFRMADVIEGWKEALVQMRVGSEWRLFVPPHLAYGDEGLAQIPGGQTLIYDLELIGVREDSKVIQNRRLRLLKRIKLNDRKGKYEKGKGPGPGVRLDNLDLIE